MLIEDQSISAIRELWRTLYQGEHQELLDSFVRALEKFRSEHQLAPLPAEWYKDVVVYSLYVDKFNGTFEGLTERLDYLQSLGVTCLWLLPILRSPMKDAGFDISDFTKVRPELARGEDAEAAFDGFVQAAHERGISIIFDIAFNHSSIEHPWFQAAEGDKDSPYRDYYIWSDTDRLYGEARIIFKGMMESNWTRLGDQYYFHRFFDIQPDLNYRNPRVLGEMALMLAGWLARGVDGFRADAIPYLWKAPGTNCENLPETHTILKIFRAVCDFVRPGTILLAEANQPPREVAAYFGEGDECLAAYHFPLMPRLYKALATAERRAIIDALDEGFTPAIPANCRWFVFLRCHDELTLEMVTPEERVLVYGYFVSDPAWDFRQGEGISARLATLLENDSRRINLMHGILLTLLGTPVIYFGDEVGSGNDQEHHTAQVIATGYHDSRHLVRGPMDWPRIESDLAEPSSLASLVFYPLRDLIAGRRVHRALTRGKLEFDDMGDERVLAYTRTLGDESVRIMANLSADQVELATGTLAPYEFAISDSVRVYAPGPPLQVHG